MDIAIAKGTTHCKVITLKTYPHLRKFIEGFYRVNEHGEVRVDMYNSLGIVLSNSLRSKKKMRSNQLERLTDRLTINLAYDLSKLSLQPRIVYQFNVDMDRVFKDHIIEWIVSQTDLGTVSVTDAILSFQKKYKINESDYSFENIYRHYTRWKNDEYYQKRKSA